MQVSPLSAITPDDIDWSALSAEPEAVREVTRFIVKQMHFVETSNLALYSSVLTLLPYDAAADQRLLLILSSYNGNRASVWKEYLKRVDGDDQVMPELHRFYNELFSETDPVLVLLIIETFNIAGIAFYEAFEGIGDRVFNEIAEKAAVQKREEYGMVLPWLRERLRKRPMEQRQRLVADSQLYIDLIEEMYEQTHAMDGGFDAELMRDKTMALMDRTYRNLGLQKID